MPTLIYADTSAVAKLFIAEPESPDLRRWLASREEPRLVSSALLGVELTRLMRLARPSALAAAETFLVDDVDLAQVTSTLLADASHVAPPRLRTLDAIHLATALDLGPAVDVMLCYDKLLADAASAAGLTVEHPGAG